MIAVDTVIVSGGDIQDDFALDFLKEAQERRKKAGLAVPQLVAADRGLDFFRRQNLTPDLAVGDFDSLSAEGEAYLDSLGKNHGRTKILRLRPEKDDSDTQAAAVFAILGGARQLAVLGAMGKRIDHLIANLELLVRCQGLESKVLLVDAWNLAMLVESGTVLNREEQFGKYVSFFPVGGDVDGLTLTGFKYGLDGYHLKPSDSGLTVSNEIVADQAQVTFEKGTLLMIMTRDVCQPNDPPKKGGTGLLKSSKIGKMTGTIKRHR